MDDLNYEKYRIRRGLGIAMPSTEKPATSVQPNGACQIHKSSRLRRIRQFILGFCREQTKAKGSEF